MRILHYFLGFNRAGGLNRYAASLAETQAKQGHAVFALCPGGSIFYRKKAVIKKSPPVFNVQCFELLHGKAIPLLEGIRDPRMMLDHRNELPDSDLQSFCTLVHPDICHIHTWMGFPKDLIFVLHQQGCKIVFTTHDYFGICPKINLIKRNGDLCTNPCNEECSKCNATAPSERYLQLRNINLLFKHKNKLALLRKWMGEHHSSKISIEEKNIPILDYRALKEYYHNMLKLCDVIHFNSEVTKRIYLQYYPDLDGRIISITHCGIMDRRKDKQLDSLCINLCFVGSLAPYKGFPMLKSTLQRLKEKQICNWRLDVWGNDTLGMDYDIPEIVYRGHFCYNEEHRVFTNTDLLIVPSIWFESYGFVILEALSFGVPVLCSDTVGAQCLVSSRMVFHGKDDLEHILITLLNNPGILKQERKRICSPAVKILTMDEHVTQIEKLYTEASS